MKKYILTGVAAVLAVSGLLAGCSTSGGGNEAVKESSPSTGVPVKPVKIEIARPGADLPKPEDDYLKQALDKKLGIDMVITQVGDADYKNQLNVRLAAGNYPDVFVLEPGEIKEFSDKGLLLDLSPQVDKLKPLIEFQGQEDFKRGNFGGKQYAVPRKANIPFDTFWIRKDWLDKLKLQPPANLEEFKAVAKAFVEQDPDSNGKKDTLGLTGFEYNTFAPLFGSFGVGTPGNLYVKNGKLTSAVFDPAMKDALAYLKGLIDEGTVDMEFITNKNGLDRDKAFQGKAGIFFTGWQNLTRKDSEVKWKTINPQAEWVQLVSPKGPGGQFDASYDYGKAPQYFVLSKAVEKDPAKLQKILDLFNYMATDEGLKLVSYGIEGRHYKLNGGKVEPTELLDKEGGYFSIYQMSGRNEMEYLSTRFSYADKILKFTNEQPRIKIVNSYIYNYPAGFNKNDMDRYVKEEMIKFLFGKRPLSEYDQFLNTVNTTFQHNAYMSHAEKILKENGILK